MCMVDDGEGHVEIFKQKHITARKQHKCRECYRVIEKGERYLREFGITNYREPFDHKTCRHCEPGRDLVQKKCRGFLYGAICEDLMEHCHKGIDWAVLAGRYAVGMRRKWKKFFSDELMEVIPYEP